MGKLLKYGLMFGAAMVGLKYLADNPAKVQSVKDSIKARLSPDAVKSTAESAEPGKQ